MSRAAEHTGEFGGAERLFRLPIGRLRALQEKTDCGPVELHNRFVSGNWRIDDLRETLLQGLIGGGMDVASASKLIQGQFDDLPKAQFVDLAYAVITAALFGAPDEPGETAAGAETANHPSREENSGSETSTKQAAPSSGTPVE